MSLDNINPVLFIAIKPNLSKEEQEELLSLEQMATEGDKSEEAKLQELRAKVKVRQPLSNMIPLIIDGEAIPAQQISANTQMNKNIELLGNEFVTSPTINITTITLVTNTEGIYQTLMDIIMYLADWTFGQVDRAPNVAFFSRGAVIPRGFLVGVSKVGDSDGTRETITLSIARDLSNLIPEIESPTVAKIWNVTNTWIQD